MDYVTTSRRGDDHGMHTIYAVAAGGRGSCCWGGMEEDREVIRLLLCCYGVLARLWPTVHTNAQ